MAKKKTNYTKNQKGKFNGKL